MHAKMGKNTECNHFFVHAIDTVLIFLQRVGLFGYIRDLVYHSDASCSRRILSVAAAASLRTFALR